MLGSVATRLPWLQGRIRPVTWMCVWRESCVLPGLCVGLITRLEESYWVWLWSLLMGRSLVTRGLLRHDKKRALLSINFTDFLINFNKTYSVYNRKTYIYMDEVCLHTSVSCLSFRYWKQSVHTRKSLLTSGWSLYITRVRYPSRNCDRRTPRELPYL